MMRRRRRNPKNVGFEMLWVFFGGFEAAQEGKEYGFCKIQTCI
jgi:hypothetical protein